MDPLQLLAIALAGGAGAALRYLVDSHMPQARFPSGTFLVNIVGAFLLGLFTGMLIMSVIPDTLLSILGTGFCGGFTTFSTASLTTVEKLREGDTKTALMYAWGMLLACIIMAYLGMILGTHLGNSL